MAAESFHGLLQHSFALRVPPGSHPLYAREHVASVDGLLRRIFTAGDFELDYAGMARGLEGEQGKARNGAWDHSLLTSRERTFIDPLRLPFKEPGGKGLPQSLSWAKAGGRTGADKEEDWEAFAFGDSDRRHRSTRGEYALASSSSRSSPGYELTSFLCQLLAHRRSQLFGLTLARNTFNVLPPHALLLPRKGDPTGEWLAQPVISLFRVAARRGFRPMFSFSLFLIPCTRCDAGLDRRPMDAAEIRESVKSQWPLATAFGNPRDRPQFRVEGPLATYLSAAAKPSLESLGLTASDEALDDRLTLREFTETTLLSLATLMARGPGADLEQRARAELGDRIVTSLSASRVSSVAVAVEDRAESHRRALRGLASEIARPLRSQRQALEEYRLDKPFFDRPGYASAVLPDDRCLITVGNARAQQGLETSVVLEAMWFAYMAMGAATATGLIRSVFAEIATADRSKPDRIAAIEREALVDLHETYDIEITVEAYRKHYRLLRDHIGITAEYKALSKKLEALYRETTTRYEARSEQRLTVLTWAITILSAVIAVGTLVLIFKGG